MAEIRIRRKGGMSWWPVLLLVLAVLAWYLLRTRQQAPAGVPGAVPAATPSAPAPR